MSQSNLTFTRKERKYLVLENSFEELTELLNGHIPINIYNGDDPISYIETTYLDTCEHLLFNEYLQRRNFRFKIRLRRYGYEKCFEDQYMVELKAKHEGISSKKRFILPAKYLSDFLKGKNLKEEVKEANKGLKGTQKSYKLVAELMKLNNLRPVLRTSYERIAFQKKSKKIRITMDRNIVHEKINGVKKVENIDAIILESKVMGKTPKWHKNLVNKLSLLKQPRFSKYATGMNSVYYPARGKYNFYSDGIEETQTPECIDKSFVLINAYLKLDAQKLEK